MGIGVGCCYCCLNLYKVELCGCNHKITEQVIEGLFIWKLDIGLLYDLGMLQIFKPRLTNGFYHGHEGQEVIVVVHQYNRNDAPRLKLTEYAVS